MRENSIALGASRLADSVAVEKAIAVGNYWDQHPALAAIGMRYLSRCKIRRESSGLVFVVPTAIQLKTIQPLKPVLEQVLNEKIIGFEIFREERRTPTGQSGLPGLGGIPGDAGADRHLPSTQLAIQLSPVNPHVDQIERERARRMSPPHFVNSPALEVPSQLVSRWGSQLKNGNQGMWLYGAPGSGKTTLLRQLNHWVSLNYRIQFIDVMSFFCEWRKALDQNDTFTFNKKYRRETDLLVLENIEELRGKVGTQHEILITLNALSERGASFAVTSSIPPQELKADLDPQLYSRLLSGLAIELAAPDRVFKENLWRHMMTQHGLGLVQVDLVVLEKLFGLNLSTARKVQVVFLNAIARLSVAGTLCLQDVYEFEGIHAPQVVPMTSTGVNPRQLIDKVAKLSGTTTASVFGKSRKQEVVFARKFIYLALSRMLGMTNTSIAHYVEKDPSTVCHGLKTVQEDLVNHRHVAKQWNWICSELGLKDSSYTTH